MTKVTEALINFIDKTPNAYNCIKNIKHILKEEHIGFKQQENTIKVLKK
ncbi:MAG: hypothetical protein HFJ12_05385 [Bacilli bacterium]|nr:hypothetical protein [Bacilli bacterium]